MDKRTKTITAKKPAVVAPKRVVETEAMRREQPATDRWQRVAERAYERFAARGYAHGHDVEDWLAAEAEIL